VYSRCWALTATRRVGGLAAAPLVSLVGGPRCRTLIPTIHRRGCFALFDLVGKQLSPRIRDLGGITLYRTGQRADFTARYPRAGPPLTRRLNTELITTHWDDLLRIAASVKYRRPAGWDGWWSDNPAARHPIVHRKPTSTPDKIPGS
jgi:hypothetical protein